jgi:SAM-dependent methyltransferase
MFSLDDSKKYSHLKINGTGYLAFKDIEMLIYKYHINVYKILDFGCGYGRSTRFLKQFSKIIYGCDIDQNAILACQKTINSERFYINNNNEIFDYHPFTAIFAFFVIFHISKQNALEHLFECCYRSLDHTGTFIIISGTKELYTKNYLSVQGLTHPKDNGDSASILLKNINLTIDDTYWSEEYIKHLALSVGFKEIYYHYPIINDPNVSNIYLDEKHYPPYYIGFLKK